MAAAVPRVRGRVDAPRRASVGGAGRRAGVSASRARGLLRLAVLAGTACLVSLHLRAASLAPSAGKTDATTDLPQGGGGRRGMRDGRGGRGRTGSGTRGGKAGPADRPRGGTAADLRGEGGRAAPPDASGKPDGGGARGAGSRSAPGSRAGSGGGDGWRTDPSLGLPPSSRGRILISHGLCCSPAAQTTTTRETSRHDHSRKRYDVSAVLSSYLWSSKTSDLVDEKGHRAEVRVVIAAGYIAGDPESEGALSAVRRWLNSTSARPNSGPDDGGDAIPPRVDVWPIDVSSYPAPDYACVRAGQMGRYYVHESGLVRDGDFVMTSDADVLPVDARALLPFAGRTNGGGEYHRAYVRGWSFQLGGKRTAPLFGTGMTAHDWGRSLGAAGAPSLRDAIEGALATTRNTWGYDQSLSTAALKASGLCHFPWVKSTSEAAGHDSETCLKGTDERGNGAQCLDGAALDDGKRRGCEYAHFTPGADASLFGEVYDRLSGSDDPKTGRRYRTADEILGYDLKLDSLRREARNGEEDSKSCRAGLADRGCGPGGARRASLPYVSGDLFRCLADVVLDETRGYEPSDVDWECLDSIEGGRPVLVFTHSDMLHKSMGQLEHTASRLGRPFVLITHNSDHGFDPSLVNRVESIPNLVHWYGQNLRAGVRTTTLPIGLENRHHGRADPGYYARTGGVAKEHLAIATFRPRNDERRSLLARLQGEDWVHTPGHGYGNLDPNLPAHEAWLRRQASYKFAISPPGHGTDCHRTWEMILVGVVPVVRRTEIDSVFGRLADDGAVLLVDGWDEVDEALLERHWNRYGEGLVRDHAERVGRLDDPALGRHWSNELLARSSMWRHEASRRAAAAALSARVHFRTYGNAKFEGSRRRIVREAEETGWFASSVGWGPDDLDPDFRETYRDILKLPRGGGYWIWKFNVIEKTMDTLVEEGDFLLYADAGSSINKGGEARFRDYVRMISESEYDMIGFQLPMLEHKWNTNRMFAAFNISLDDGDRMDVTHTGQYESSELLLQKGPHYRRWLELCKSVLLSDPWLITDKYNEESRGLNPTFKENRHDQSIMSLSRKILGCVVVSATETKNERPDMPFHVKRLRTPVEEETGQAATQPSLLPPPPPANGSGPQVHVANSSTVDDAVSVCSGAEGRSPCPLRAYCSNGQLSGRIPSVEGRVWAPVMPEGQAFWIAVGSEYPCMQSGMLDEEAIRRPAYILCCRGGEDIDEMPKISAIDQTGPDEDHAACSERCRSSSGARAVIPSKETRYCLARCRWLRRQQVVAMLSNHTDARDFDGGMTASPPIAEGRCTDLAARLKRDVVCDSPQHRQKPIVSLVLSSKSWLARELNAGPRDCPASRCDVSTGPSQTDNSHLFLGTITQPSWDKANSRQVNAIIQPESLPNTNKGKGAQPKDGPDWIVSHRQDGFDSDSWLRYSYANSDKISFRIRGKDHSERRTQIPLFIKNCNPDSVHSDRLRQIAEIGKHLDIEQFGKCHIEGTTKADLQTAYPQCAIQNRRSAMWDGVKECVYFHSMFALVAENTYEEGYVTEKFYQPLKMGAVPIVLGNSTLFRRHLPASDAAIFPQDFDNIQTASEYIHTVENNSTRWRGHLKWKDLPLSSGLNWALDNSFAHIPCNMCDKYAEDVLPEEQHRTLDLDGLDTCVEDILTRNTLPVNLPLINPVLGLDAVFVTHYTPLKERKAAMMERVGTALDTTPTFVEDFDRESISDDDVSCFGNSTAQLAYIQRIAKKGEVSLVMKHFAVYYYMVKHSLDNVLILEDDAAFYHSDWAGENSLYQQIMKDLPVDYDMIFFSSFGANRKKGTKVTDNIYLSQESRVASMYLCSQKGARNMLRSLPMVGIIDFHMNYAAKHKGNSWMEKLPSWKGPHTIDMKLYHSHPPLSVQIEPDGSRNRTGSWRNDEEE